MIDFHCHLDLYPDPEAIARGCVRNNVRLLSVTTTPSAWRRTSTLVGIGSWTALGLHPQLAHERGEELALFDELLPHTRFVGEIGLDGGPGFRSHQEDQIVVLDHILRSCARAGGRILSVHSRRAAGPVLDRIEACPGAGPVVLHWFSGGMRELKRAIDLGCWFSVGPAMLNGERGRERARLIPQDRILTESDGPFGRIGREPLLPWQVGIAVSALSEMWGSDTEEAQAVLDENLRRLVGSL